MNCQCGERNDIVDIVRENAFQRRSWLVLKIIEISSRDHRSGYIGAAHERNHLPFKSNEAATAVPTAPKAACAEKKIEVRHIFERAVQTGERESDFEQRDIE